MTEQSEEVAVLRREFERIVLENEALRKSLRHWQNLIVPEYKHRLEQAGAEVAWLRTPILHTEVCANCGHAKFHHHDYRDGKTANDRTRCWGGGYDRDDCAARCEEFVRLTHDGSKP